MGKHYHFSEFPGTDTIERLNAAMAALKENEGSTLEIEPGEYLLTTELARQAVENVMSGAWGGCPQGVMFHPSYKYSIGMDLSGHKGTTILATGAKFIVDGFMEPLSIRDSEDVTIVGLTVDHKRKPFSAGTLGPRVTVSDTEAYHDVILDDDCPVTPETPRYLRNFIYNLKTARIEFPHIDNGRLEFLDSHTLRLYGTYFGDDYTGLRYYIWHTYHSRPVLFIQRCKNVTVRDFTVHSAPGMGITCDRTENVLLDGYRNVPAEGYHVSTNTDATHFTACKGKITVRNSTFIGQGDDSLNVHGYYHTVIEQDGCRCLVRCKFPDGISHSQSPDYPDVGDTMEINDPDTLALLGTRKVVSYKVDEEDGSLCEIVLDQPLPADAVERQLFLFDSTRVPACEFDHNVCLGHFANGLRVRTRNAHIHDNRFEDIMITAITVNAEGVWGEGTNPADVIIENNEIRRCGYLIEDGVSGVQIGVRCHVAPSNPQIKNVVIRNNEIDCPNVACAIEATGVDGLVVEGNTFLPSAEALRLNECANVVTDLD